MAAGLQKPKRELPPLGKIGDEAPAIIYSYRGKPRQRCSCMTIECRRDAPNPTLTSFSLCSLTQVQIRAPHPVDRSQWHESVRQVPSHPRKAISVIDNSTTNMGMLNMVAMLVQVWIDHRWRLRYARAMDNALTIKSEHLFANSTEIQFASFASCIAQTSATNHADHCSWC